MEDGMKMDIYDLFLTVCSELADKIPEEKTRFERMKAECIDGYLNTHSNLCILMTKHIDILDKGTVDSFVRVLRAGGFALDRFEDLPNEARKKMTRTLTLEYPRPFNQGPERP